MTRQRTRLGRMAGRVAIGLATAGLFAAAVLLAPPSGATPETDADAAITAAWEAGGADTGPLGPRDGGVYAAGDGFGQNFAGGKMFFTPETGAHFMQGAILEKYESLGGAAEGDLGFPTIDEGPGKAADSRNSTFSAPDNPVIFWTPGTGAHVVRGAINTAWDTLGGSDGVLGAPSEDETVNGDVSSQKFTGGEISWDRKTRAFTTTPPELAEQLGALDIPADATSAIAAARRAAGGALGPLGAEEGAQYAIGADGVGQNFAGGKIFYSPQTGANVVTGQVLEKYESVGGPSGDLGFPTANETDGGLAPESRVSTFAAEDKPVIFWTPDFGAVIVRGPMNAAWAKLGGATGELGAPKSDQTENGNVTTQQFDGGSISWDRAEKKFSTEPAALQSQLAGLEVPDAQAPQAPPAATPSGESGGDKWYTSWWWLLGLIPLLGLIALVAFAVTRNRRSHDDDDHFGDHLDQHYDQRPDQGYGDQGYGGGYDDNYEGGYDDRSDAPREARVGDEFDRRSEFESFDGGPEFQRFEPEPGAFAGNDPGGYAPESPWASALPVAGASVFGANQPEPDERDDTDGSAESDETDDFDDFEEFDDGNYADAGPRDDLDGSVDEYADELEDLPSQEAPLQDETLDLDFEADSDAIDTAPTPIVSLTPERGGAQQAVDAGLPVEHEPEVSTGRHAAVQADEPDTGRMAMKLATGDRYHAPEGYPIKAVTETGLYWVPGTPGYREVEAEVWFASEEFARTNGFARAQG